MIHPVTLAGIVLVAVGAGYALSVSWPVRTAYKPTDALIGLRKSSGKKTGLHIKPITFVTAAVYAAGVLVFTGNLYTTIVVLVGSWLSFNLAASDSMSTRIDDLRSVLTFAETIFPMLRSQLSRTSVLEQASISLPPKMRQLLEESVEYCATNKLSQRSALHLFAALEGSPEIDLIMGVTGIAFDVGNESIGGQLAETVTQTFKVSIDSLSKTVADRSELTLTGKMAAYVGFGVIVFLMMVTASSFPTAWTGVVGDVSVTAASALLVAASLTMKMVARPRSQPRLIDSDVVLRDLESRSKGGES